MAKSIITQDGDLVNYNNLITIIVDKRPLPNETVDTFCLIGVDTTNEPILLYHSDNLDDVERVKRDLYRWLQSEAFSTFEMPAVDESGDAQWLRILKAVHEKP